MQEQEIMNLFNSTPVVDNNFENLPDGKYIGTINQVSVSMTDSPWKIAWEIDVTSCLTNSEIETHGRKVWLNGKMDQRGIGYIKKNMKTLGLNYENIKTADDLGEELAKCHQTKVKFTLKNKKSEKDPSKTFAAVYLDEKVQDDEFGF